MYRNRSLVYVSNSPTRSNRSTRLRGTPHPGALVGGCVTCSPTLCEALR